MEYMPLFFLVSVRKTMTFLLLCSLLYILPFAVTNQTGYKCLGKNILSVVLSWKHFSPKNLIVLIV